MKNAGLLLISIFILLVFFLISPKAAACNAREAAALLRFKSSLAISSVGALGSWDPGRSCCDWRGVKCSSNSSSKGAHFGVRELRLSALGLSAAADLPPLADLIALQSLDLSSNNFSGSIFSILPLLPISLRELNLSNNLLGGSLPISSVPLRLRSLDLSLNSFNGSIPDAFPCAAVVNLSSNLLTGPARVPTRCAGVLRAFLGEANRFTSLNAGSLVAATVLLLNSNCIAGHIPGNIGLLRNVTQLNLGYNLFSGSIPTSLSNCCQLELLSLRNNHLEGGISHVDFPALTRLATLDLSYNSLSGHIPASLASCSQLQALALAKNSFGGHIPESLGSLQQLHTLLLSANNLVGGLPASLQNCSSLVSLVVSKNSFTQALPDGGITGFRRLQLLAIGNANLSGTVPAWLANCTRLQVLDMSWNRLTGPVPRWLGDLEHLFYLDLSNNSLTGHVPAELGSIRVLQQRDVDDDPTAQGLQPVANTLFVKHKSNASALQYNQVSAFPPSIILASNLLTGSIPATLGGLRRLVALDLSSNRLTGRIPAALSRVTDLESLDLSNNALTGSVPAELTDLTFLASFNVSYNRLTGRVPSRNQFASFSNSSYLGNAGLCGGNMPLACADAASAAASGVHLARRRVARGALMGVAISVSLGLTALFAGMLLLSVCRRRVVNGGPSAVDPEADFKELSLAQMMGMTVTMFDGGGGVDRRICVTDLVKATNNFDPANIIGCGGFGLVFKAHLPGGRTVAIKRLSSDGAAEMEREFDAELMTLGRVSRHPNLVPLEGYCRLGSRDRLLVYTFMENGSLDHWLHERPDGGASLAWRARLAILRGAARGLDYLHRGCDPHIVHRDIKSSNILLDADMAAHVADFGLARLMLPSDTHVTTELVGTLGYIPPEYAQTAVASLRGDVYSFGVLALEVLSRRRPVDNCRRGGARDLVPWVRLLRAERRAHEILDPLMLVDAADRPRPDVDQMLRVMDVACRCVDPCPQRRPSIDQVVSALDEV